jgi:nucleotide-binding universal stress UspA family protein
MATQNPSDRAPGTTLIAGYDGSESAAAAVRWAAAQTADGGRSIVVCADHPAVPRPALAVRSARAKAGLEALLRAARDAVDGTAVGSRGIGSSSADTGVSSTLLRSANRPVLVIPSAALPHPQDS